MSHRGRRVKPVGVICALAAPLGVFAFLYLLAGPASAANDKLTIPRATAKAEDFAERTCSHDGSCVDSGVLNCNRKGKRVVHCRIFDDRHTDVQGKYRCHREIRMVMDPDTHRVPVNGLGHWHCGGGGEPS
jgi:hypothetical protein